jgi:hypothetical protein
MVAVGLVTPRRVPGRPPFGKGNSRDGTGTVAGVVSSSLSS